MTETELKAQEEEFMKRANGVLEEATAPHTNPCSTRFKES
jgi:hypothetical protein